MGHAYILSGEPAPLPAAEAACAALLCRRPNAAGLACGACDECARVAGGNHPGLTRLHPDGASLRIAQMRAAWRGDIWRPSGTDLAIVLLSPADRLTVEAGNAILKWVEEPHPGRVFLLVTDAPANLLPTLRSRCAWLRVEGGADERFAGAEEDPRADAAAALTAAILSGDAAARWEALARVSELAGSMDEWVLFADAWLACLRHLARLAAGSGDTVPAASRRRLESPALAADVRTAARIGLLAAEFRKRLLRHANAPLALEGLLLSAAAGAES